jgi:hypothetical protein
MNKLKIKSEEINRLKFFNKWGGMPTFDEYGTINGIKK